MKKKGFTLIELLAVIVILAIIAVIATPIIVGIIEDSRKAAFERSVEGILHATDIDFGTQEVLSNNSYTISNGVLNKTLKTPIKNLEGFNGTIKYDEKGNSQYAIHNGKWCMMKDSSGVITTKDYVDGDCELLLLTSESCFRFENGIIRSYYQYENNDSNNPECPRDVVIPNKINGIEVTTIGGRAFQWSFITSVKFPDTIHTIEEYAFAENTIKGELDLSNLVNLKYIPQYAFSGATAERLETYDATCEGEITSIKFPDNLESIANDAFTCQKIMGELDFSNTKIKTIGDYAFSSHYTLSSFWPTTGEISQITSIKFPATIESIGYVAFRTSNTLTQVTFVGRTNLDGVTLDSSIGGWAEGYSDDDIKFEPIAN